jgi:hypothetical protein
MRFTGSIASHLLRCPYCNGEPSLHCLHHITTKSASLTASTGADLHTADLQTAFVKQLPFQYQRELALKMCFASSLSSVQSSLCGSLARKVDSNKPIRTRN